MILVLHQLQRICPAYRGILFRIAVLLAVLRRERYWTQDFADSIKFTGDPVVAIPDVNEVWHVGSSSIAS